MLAQIFWKWNSNIPMPCIPLCCRIVIVKLSKGETIHSIAEPKDLPLSTYDEVHRSPSASGAYVAEAFSRYVGLSIIWCQGICSVISNNSIIFVCECQQLILYLIHVICLDYEIMVKYVVSWEYKFWWLWTSSIMGTIECIE